MESGRRQNSLACGLPQPPALAVTGKVTMHNIAQNIRIVATWVASGNSENDYGQAVTQPRHLTMVAAGLCGPEESTDVG
jgi:hypothetical protein